MPLIWSLSPQSQLGAKLKASLAPWFTARFFSMYEGTWQSWKFAPFRPVPRSPLPFPVFFGVSHLVGFIKKEKSKTMKKILMSGKNLETFLNYAKTVSNLDPNVMIRMTPISLILIGYKFKTHPKKYLYRICFYSFVEGFELTSDPRAYSQPSLEVTIKRIARKT